MEYVVIGMDPHKRSVTIEVITGSEQVLAKQRFATTAEGFTQLMRYARQWPDRLGAVSNVRAATKVRRRTCAAS